MNSFFKCVATLGICAVIVCIAKFIPNYTGGAMFFAFFSILCIWNSK